MSHYFTQTPDAKHNEQFLSTSLRGHTFSFYTDNGVFSKDGVDFGSRILIETMRIPQGDRVLDMGCGWGPVGIVAAYLNPTGQVLMADVNKRALNLAQKNIALNNLVNAVTRESDIYACLQNEQFDVILTNPPIRAGKAIVHSIFAGAVEHLKCGGSLWVVIQKKQGASSAEKKLRELFREVNIHEKRKGYIVFEAVI